MSYTEAYLFLFFDSIMSCLVLVRNTTMVFNLMKVFGGYNHTLMIFISLVGSVVGASINYLLGMALHSIKQSIKGHQDSERFIDLARYADSKLVFLSALSFLSMLGVMITTAAGFLRVNYTKFIIIFLLGRLGYYLYLL